MDVMACMPKVFSIHLVRAASQPPGRAVMWGPRATWAVTGLAFVWAKCWIIKAHPVNLKEWALPKDNGFPESSLVWNHLPNPEAPALKVINKADFQSWLCVPLTMSRCLTEHEVWLYPNDPTLLLFFLKLIFPTFFNVSQKFIKWESYMS